MVTTPEDQSNGEHKDTFEVLVYQNTESGTETSIKKPSRHLFTLLEDSGRARFDADVSQIDQLIDRQEIMHSFIQAGKCLDEWQIDESEYWVRHAFEIAKRLPQRSYYGKCKYWEGRIAWSARNELKAYWCFEMARVSLKPRDPERAEISLYMKYLKPGPDRKTRREEMTRLRGFVPPHELTARKNNSQSAVNSDPKAHVYNRYSFPSLKRKRGSLAPDTFLAVDMRRENNTKRKPPSTCPRVWLIKQSDHHMHPGDGTVRSSVTPSLYSGLKIVDRDFHWLTTPQQIIFDTPPGKFKFTMHPTGVASRVRRHKIFRHQPWEDDISRKEWKAIRRNAREMSITLDLLAKEWDLAEWKTKVLKSAHRPLQCCHRADLP
ncbi:hypothetical protein EYZ11_009988 [Aspergillus tanneri]|uniref:Uncharacterized protein n=1 Tax=Aspergillus tanneri TaxID=1220188 RepID=A0A4S3J8L8_9EURO|nr:uncharacterized protein ATNIH1004_004166 [Aspergillus tanneri]KAA8648282.1 hypothetical protein ATNIH1004_004166 [Aspergillus tanneri]THC90547.1 hypothetical protein EYZ11_009988 [Aspergillus tanneri]